MAILFFFLASIGMAHIIIESRITASFRVLVLKIFGEDSKANYMVHCYQCMGFHAGVVMSIIFNLCGISLSGLGWGAEQFICGCACAFMSMLGAALITYLDMPHS